MFFCPVCHVLSLPVQLIAWKDLFPKWPIMCRAGRKTLLTHSLWQNWAVDGMSCLVGYCVYCLASLCLKRDWLVHLRFMFVVVSAEPGSELSTLWPQDSCYERKSFWRKRCRASRVSCLLHIACREYYYLIDLSLLEQLSLHAYFSVAGGRVHALFNSIANHHHC